MAKFPRMAGPNRGSAKRGRAARRMKALLELAAGRHYGPHDLTSLRSADVDGRPFVACDYDPRTPPHRATAVTAVLTVGRFDELVGGGPLPAALLARLTAAAPASHGRVADLYLSWPQAPEEADERSAALRHALAASGIAGQARRIAVGVAGRGPDGRARIEYFTFRCRRAWGDDEFSEDVLVRGAHPQAAGRPHLWRLRNFRVARITDPGAPDPAGPILLYHCTARDNPDHQRLIALAAVTRIRPERDARMVLGSCVAAIGRARRDLGPAGGRLDGNQVWLDIAPVVDVAAPARAGWQRTGWPETVRSWAAASGADRDGVEEIALHGRLADRGGEPRAMVTRLAFEPDGRIAVSVEEPSTRPLPTRSASRPLSDPVNRENSEGIMERRHNAH